MRLQNDYNLRMETMKEYMPIRIYIDAYNKLAKMADDDQRSIVSMVSWLISEEWRRRERRKKREQKGQGGADGG